MMRVSELLHSLQALKEDEQFSTLYPLMLGISGPYSFQTRRGRRQYYTTLQGIADIADDDTVLGHKTGDFFSEADRESAGEYEIGIERLVYIIGNMVPNAEDAMTVSEAERKLAQLCKYGLGNAGVVLILDCDEDVPCTEVASVAVSNGRVELVSTGATSWCHIGLQNWSRFQRRM